MERLRPLQLNLLSIQLHLAMSSPSLGLIVPFLAPLAVITADADNSYLATLLLRAKPAVPRNPQNNASTLEGSGTLMVFPMTER